MKLSFTLILLELNTINQEVFMIFVNPRGSRDVTRKISPWLLITKPSNMIGVTPLVYRMSCNMKVEECRTNPCLN